jgi:hypothetical protein
MAVLIVMDWAETEADYGEIVARMGVQGAPADGIFLHVAAATPTGIRIVELWDEPEGYERFVRERLLPTAKEAGVTTEPVYTVTEVMNLFGPKLDQIEKLAATFAG